MYLDSLFEKSIINKLKGSNIVSFIERNPSIIMIKTDKMWNGSDIQPGQYARTANYWIVNCKRTKA